MVVLTETKSVRFVSRGFGRIDRAISRHAVVVFSKSDWQLCQIMNSKLVFRSFISLFKVQGLKRGGEKGEKGKHKTTNRHTDRTIFML